MHGNTAIIEFDHTSARWRQEANLSQIAVRITLLLQIILRKFFVRII